ncbi:RNA-guided endonuclease InsQ/TnpB family protein [Actinopolyspora biskrensis]|uniref:RNA-guided endonuclease InsQ/TnpB family protein n=1 Tax=Actinopolyspora biskrensis TaxID=1470178 RepID=UPI001FE7783D|nr:transposase [Actinopolyspora biskrensis]
MWSGTSRRAPLVFHVLPDDAQRRPVARGGEDRAKARKRLARRHAEVADTRADWPHKESTRLIRENRLITVEDLAASGLARTRPAKSVQDASWGRFRRILSEKAHRYGRELVVVDRWLSTSRTCSECGRIDGPKPLSVREWSCPCGAAHDRDAANILAAGRAERRNACGDRGRPHTGGRGRRSRKQRNPARGHRSARGWGRVGIPAVNGGEHVNCCRVRNASGIGQADSTETRRGCSSACSVVCA